MEIDYSGLHIALLYANLGIDYFAEFGDDPYALDLPGYDGTPEELRAICKSLVLVALNANNDDENNNEKTFQAFRDKAKTGSPEKRMKDKELAVILDALRDKHELIADKFASDAGIDLMNQDAKIAEKVIGYSTAREIPVLAVHDSFIAPYDRALETYFTMQNAYMLVTGMRKAKTDNAWTNVVRTYGPGALPKIEIPGMIILSKTDLLKRTARYRRNRDRFREWLASQESGSVRELATEEA